MPRRKTTSPRKAKTAKTTKKASRQRPGSNWGGARPGAGRPPSPDSGAPHHARAQVRPSTPVHLTVPFASDVPSPRTRAAHQAVRLALAAGREKSGFRIVHYALLPDRLHLIVEARDRESLSRSVQGVLVSLARKLNAVQGREGKVFSDRYRDRVLESPQQVRDALAETLASARRRGLVKKPGVPDVFSSGAWFDGWRSARSLPEESDEPVPVVEPKSQLLRTGWRRLGLLALDEAPTTPLVPTPMPARPARSAKVARRSLR